MTKLTESDMVDLVVELAQQVESTDSIDLAMFPTSEDSLYRVAATQILENFNMIKNKDDQIMMLLATTVKLVVENAVLNYQVLSHQKPF
jgi:hypothetical protein